MSDDAPGRETWWTRPCGLRDVLRLALPLIVSTASWSIMNFTDRMFLLWHSQAEMAAAFPSGMLYFTLACLPLGVVSYVNTFVAQYHGAGRSERIGLAMWQSVRICLWAIPAMLVLVPAAPWVFAVAGHEPGMARLETIYFQYVAVGSGGLLLSGALSAFFTGRGQTWVVMLVDTFGAVLNIVLDYLWIFGYGGFPEMGIAGAAAATAVSQWVQAALYWWLMHRGEVATRYGLREGRRHDPALSRRLWRFGWPNGMQMLVEVAAFSVFILFVGRLGESHMAATTLAFNINAVAFVPMLGLGLAVTTIVGQQLGRDRADLAARAAWTALAVAELYMGTLALLYVAVPDAFLFGHAKGADPAEFAVLRRETVVLLRFVAAYSVFDALNVIFVGVIKGAGDTRFILMTTAVMSPLPVLAAWLGVEYLGLGILWCWVAVTVWVIGLGLIYLARFLQGRWRHMRVIEPAAAEMEHT